MYMYACIETERYTKGRKTSLNDAAKSDSRAAGLRNKVISKLQGTLADYRAHDGTQTKARRSVIPGTYRQMICLRKTSVIPVVTGAPELEERLEQIPGSTSFRALSRPDLTNSEEKAEANEL